MNTILCLKSSFLQAPCVCETERHQAGSRQLSTHLYQLFTFSKRLNSSNREQTNKTRATCNHRQMIQLIEEMAAIKPSSFSEYGERSKPRGYELGTIPCCDHESTSRFTSTSCSVPHHPGSLALSLSLAPAAVPSSPRQSGK